MLDTNRGFFWRTALIALLCAPAPSAGAQSSAPRADSAARAVLQRMHDAYDGKWYRTLTFVQRTTTWDTARVAKVETWYESIAQIDGRVVLRIDRGSPADGNGVLYTADSMWLMRMGKLAATRASGNVFLPVIEGVYVQPVDQTIRELRSTGVDLTQLHRTSWQGRAVIAIGASADDDLTSPQLWIDPERNVLVRMILRTAPARPALDVHLDGYERAGSAWLATKVTMLANGVAQQVEEYSDWRADPPLGASLFSTDKWTTSLHWAKP